MQITALHTKKNEEILATRVFHLHTVLNCRQIEKIYISSRGYFKSCIMNLIFIFIKIIRIFVIYLIT